MKYCCAEFAIDIRSGQVEVDRDKKEFSVNGCCGGGCFVLVDCKYCPYCGKKIEKLKCE